MESVGEDYRFEDPHEAKQTIQYCVECDKEVSSDVVYCDDCIDKLLNKFGIDFLVDKGIRFTDDDMVDILNDRIGEFIDWVRI